jgi:hypothetical protein
MSKESRKESKRKYQQSDKGKLVYSKAGKKWRDANKEYVNNKCSDYKKSPNGIESCKWSYIKSTFNMTKDEYIKKHDSQGGKCAICGNTETRTSCKGRPMRLSIDHNHSTGKIRDLLCGKCNCLIGYAEENKDILLKCVEYLKRHEETLK